VNSRYVTSFSVSLLLSTQVRKTDASASEQARLTSGNMQLRLFRNKH
jgi:hypothetical protein